MIDLPPGERITSLAPPVIIAPGPRQASFGDLVARLDPDTTSVVVTVNGRTVAAAHAVGRLVRLRVPLPQGDATIRVVARDGAGRRAQAAVGPVFGLPRAAWPAPFKSVEDARLAREVRALARSFPGTTAVFVQDLRSGRGAAWNARARFPAASTLKVAIAIEVLRTLPSQPAPVSSLGRQLRAMLVESDNAASNALLRWLGGSTTGGAARVNATLRALSLFESHMYGGFALGTAAARPIPLRTESQPAFGVGKYTTAWDLARLHHELHRGAAGQGRLVRLNGSFATSDARHILYLLARTRDRGKLDRFIGGPGVSVLHKAGWITHARHDSGVVYWWGGSFAASVMTWHPAGVKDSADVLAGRVARAALRRFKAVRRADPHGLALKSMRASA